MNTARFSTLLACLASSLAAQGCGGDSFEPGDAPASEAGTDASTDGPGKEDAVEEAGKDALAPEAAPPDAKIESGISEGGKDAVSEKLCTEQSEEVQVEADGMIIAEGSNCGAANSFTTHPCMNLNQDDSRVIMRFTIGTDAAAAFKNNTVTSVGLSVELAGPFNQCDGSYTGNAPHVSGAFTAHPLRSDWIEGGPNVGAQWCYRKGTGGSWDPIDAWQDPGADGIMDRGKAVADQLLPVGSTKVSIPLDPGGVGPWVTADRKISVQLAAKAQSLVRAYIRTHEGGAPARLHVAWCP